MENVFMISFSSETSIEHNLILSMCSFYYQLLFIILVTLLMKLDAKTIRRIETSDAPEILLMFVERNVEI